MSDFSSRGEKKSSEKLFWFISHHINLSFIVNSFIFVKLFKILINLATKERCQIKVKPTRWVILTLTASCQINIFQVHKILSSTTPQTRAVVPTKNYFFCSHAKLFNCSWKFIYDPPLISLPTRKQKRGKSFSSSQPFVFRNEIYICILIACKLQKQQTSNL